MQGIIIDAGVSPRALKKGMAEVGLSMQSVLGVCITHDHIDHILYAGAYGEKLGLPVFSTEKIHKGMTVHPHPKVKVGASKRVINHEVAFHLGPFEITAFEVPHDGSDNVGYSIKYREKTFVIATDLGHLSEGVASKITCANYLVLESNYDKVMLDSGPYPFFLKNRIKKPLGHLSNDDTAQFLSSAHTPLLSHLFLCHLSQENNRPELALQVVKSALADKKSHIQVLCLPRGKPSECFILSP
jgi:phosphoribosyl 1,2-cyclic phosphodiesterase